MTLVRTIKASLNVHSSMKVIIIIRFFFLRKKSSHLKLKLKIISGTEITKFSPSPDVWITSLDNKTTVIKELLSFFFFKYFLCRGYSDSKRHNTCKCWMKLMISLRVILMTFRPKTKKQNKKTQHKSVSSQSCDYFNIKWSRVISQSSQNLNNAYDCCWLPTA